jgi:hypothetical protein
MTVVLENIDSDVNGPFVLKWRLMIRRVGLMLLLAGCDTYVEGQSLSKLAVVQTQLTVPPGLNGDAYTFLYAPGEGPPGQPALPLYASGVSAARLSSDPRAVFAQVAPNPYRLWGLLDANLNFDPAIDVMAQPGFSDRIGAAVDLNLQPGKTAHTALTLTDEVPWEPPAFHLEGVGPDVALDANPNAILTLTLVADDLGRFDQTHGGFHLGLVDANGDGRPDDANNDGIPDLNLTAVLRLVALPGQLPAGSQLVVPLAIDPSPFLSALAGDVTKQVATDRLQAAVVAQAEELTQPPGKPPQLTPVGAPLPGQYELDLLVAGGQFWRIPNQLGPTVASQSVRLHFDRAAQ